jgi:UDP-N-acetylmuramyl pentapeptide phosphotransferase/UDP-N-acetylglucosamine-1-phosphate transferase
LTLLLILILILSFAGTFIIMQVAVRRNIMDIPNQRSSHTQPTPRGGGLAIVIAWYTGLTLLKILGILDLRLFLALMSGSLLAAVSFIDDIYDIKPSIRILAQLITACAGLHFIGGMKFIYLGDLKIEYSLILSLIAVIGIVWFINLFNFLDGIDGYASMEAILVASGMFVVTGNQSLAILIFATLGFLIWNWPKAKIFMGDIGSTQLGFILIILGLYFNNEQQFNLIGWLILTSLFWVDASVTLFRRWRNNEKLSVAHKKHFYQRIVRSGFTHKKTVIRMILVNIFFIALVYLSENSLVEYYVTFPVCLLVNYFLMRLIDHKFPFNTSE